MQYDTLNKLDWSLFSDFHSLTLNSKQSFHLMYLLWLE